METVNSVGNTVLGSEKPLNLLLVAQVGFAGNDLVGALRCSGLDNVSEDEVEVGGFGVGEQGR